MADQDEQIADLTRAYAVTFGSPAGQIVLADLEKYGHVADPLADDKASDRTFFKNEGRREVLLRILKFGNFTLRDIYNLRKGVTSLRTTEGERANG